MPSAGLFSRRENRPRQGRAVWPLKPIPDVVVFNAGTQCVATPEVGQRHTLGPERQLMAGESLRGFRVQRRARPEHLSSIACRKRALSSARPPMLGALNGFVRLAHRFHVQFVEVRTAFLGVQDVG